MGYQFREWLRATSTFAIALIGLWILSATVFDPPRVMYGGPGYVVDANVYCEQKAHDASFYLEDKSAAVTAAVMARQDCYSRSAVNVPLLLLKVLVGFGLIGVFLVVLFRAPG